MQILEQSVGAVDYKTTGSVKSAFSIGSLFCFVFWFFAFTAALHYTKITCQSERVGAAVVFGFFVDGHCCVSVCSLLFVCAAVAVSSYSAVLLCVFLEYTHTRTICTSCCMKLQNKVISQFYH